MMENFCGEQMGAQGAAPKNRIDGFDPLLPVQTRDGRPARILATDLLGTWSIVAAVVSACGTLEPVHLFTENGRACPGRRAHCDLVNVPGEQRRLCGYFGMYRTLVEDQLRATPEEAIATAQRYLGSHTEAVWLHLKPLSTA